MPINHRNNIDLIDFQLTAGKDKSGKFCQYIYSLAVSGPVPADWVAPSDFS